MSDMEFSSIDLVRELRLRKWARQHWVTPNARKPTWHPIVLNEMSLRDQELIESLRTESRPEVVTPVKSSTITSQVQANSFESMTDFHFSDFGFASRNIGSTYVPLPPTSNWELHGGTSEIPKPHYARVKSELKEYAEFRAW